MTQTKRKYLLLDLFERQLVIRSHTKKLLCFFIAGCWYVNRTVVMLRKASANDLGITLICLNSFLAALFKHGGRSKDYAVYIPVG